MPKEIDTSDYWPSCTICLENYDGEGDHVPRLLPCSHTVCESCIKPLIATDNRGNETVTEMSRMSHATWSSRQREELHTE